MTRHRIFWVMSGLLVSALSIGAAGPGLQEPRGGDWCSSERWRGDREGFCEVREIPLVATGAVLSVDARPNGGIQAEGSARGDILVQARVVATAASEQRAREIAAAVRIDAAPDRVSADGPRTLGRGESWHVSYRLYVPTMTSLALRSTNGGIGVKDVEGQIEFQTVNGGVRLANLAGDVRGRTSNGGVDVDLDGTTWRGEGLNVETSNGGVRLRIPDGYSARLEAGTVNGGFNVDIPVTVQGRIDREIVADIGGGGPLVRVRTNNGGVKVTRKEP